MREMRGIKKTGFLAVLIVLGLFMTGCYDDFDLEKRVLCTAMAVDYDKNEGYSVILSLPELSGDEEIGRRLKRAKGLSLSEVFWKLEGSTAKKLYFGHVQAVILGEGLLENQTALREISLYLEGNGEIDKNVLLAAAYDIDEVMETEPEYDKLTGFYISGFYESGNDGKTFVNKESLLGFMKEEAENKTAVLPVISGGEGGLEFCGTAVVKGDRLAGVLEGDEAYGFMWLSERGYNGAVTAGTPPVTAEIVEKETEYEFYEEGGKIWLNVNIRAVGNMWNYTDDEIKSKGAEYLKGFKGKIKSQADEAVKQLDNMDCDALGFRRILREQHSKLYREKGEKFDIGNVKVTVDFSMNFV